MFKKSNLLGGLVKSLLTSLKGGGATTAVAGSFALNWIEDKILQKAEETEKKISEEPEGDPVKETIYAFSNLANTLSSMGVTDPRWTDGEQLRGYFKSQGFNAPMKQLYMLVDSIRQFLNVIKNLNIKGNVINDTFEFVFDHYKANRYNLRATQEKLNELSKLAATPFGRIQVVATIKKNYTLLMAFTLMANFDKPQEALNDMLKIANESQILLGNASTELLDYQALQDQKLRTEVDKLTKTIDQFKLMTPLAMQKEKIMSSFYQKLSGAFGSDLAKSIVSNPVIQAGYFTTYFIKDGLSGFRAGSAEAFRTQR